MPVNSFDDYPMSWRPVLDRRMRPLYRQLSDALERDIRTGRLMPGTKLPPQRELADFLDINLSTVTKAYRLASEKGLLSAAMGNGTYVSYDALSSARLIAPFEKDVINMGATVPDPSGNEPLLALLRSMLAEPGSGRWFSHHQEDDPAWQWQKEAASQLLRLCGIEAVPETVLFSCGGQNGLSAVMAALFRRGDKIAVDDHLYPGLKTAAAMFGIQLIPVPMTEKGMDLSFLSFLLKTETVAGVYLIPTCQNPTTATMPAAAREKAAALMKAHGCLLVEDGTYQLTEPALPPVASFMKDRAVFLTSLSKVAAPGLRMGILTAPPAFHGVLSDALYSLNVSVTPLMEELSARMIASGLFPSILARHREETLRRDAVVRRCFPKDVCLGAGTDIFRWLRLSPPWTADDFQKEALRRGVLVYSASKFAVGKTKPRPAVRLSICSPALPDLSRALSILQSLIRKGPSSK